MDTMTGTKIVAGICGTLLVLLMGKWGAELIYHGGGHAHDDGHKAGYEIVVDDGPTEEVAEVPFAEVFAAADAASGERVFGKCKACHKLEDGANATGPHLYAVVGRAVEAADGFKYSGKLGEATDVWSPEHLNEFLISPKAYAPGTTMSFKGLPKPEDRANLIAYLQTFGG